METHPGKGNMKEKFPNSRKPSHRRVCGELGISEGNITRRKKKKKSPQNTCLIATASREVAQGLMSPTSEQGLGGEAGVASSVLRVRPGPDFPENNPRELT